MPEWFLEFPEKFIYVTEPIDNAIKYMNKNWEAFFDGLTAVLRTLLNGVGSVISWIPWWAVLIAVFFATWKMSKKLSRAVSYTLLMLFIGAVGYWDLMNLTLAIVFTSVIIALLIGLPTGILVASNKRADAIVRPILDTMQTMPSFVYLIPAVMLIGLGKVPAVIATTIYAVPPAIRLTSLGIKQVDIEVVEASKAFGATKGQTLFKVQIPQAMPTIMTGINQTIMMALSMVVTCSLIGAPGLGAEVIKAMNRLESGRGFVAGTAIVIVAIILDRLTQGLYKKESDEVQ